MDKLSSSTSNLDIYTTLQSKLIQLGWKSSQIFLKEPKKEELVRVIVDCLSEYNIPSPVSPLRGKAPDYEICDRASR